MKVRSHVSRLFFSIIFSLFILIVFAAPLLYAQKTTIRNNIRFIYNNDGTDILGNWMYNNRPLSKDDVYSYVDRIANTQVTTYMICPGAMQPYYESNIESPFGTCNDVPLLQKQNPEKAKPFKIYADNFKLLKEKGTDIVELCLKRAREKGMEAFLTMRMNDLHFTTTDEILPITQGKFWNRHPEYRVGDHPGWHADGALNFAIKEVREYKLNLIREMCNKFDFDGFELDFQRFLIYFPYKQGSKYLGIMNNFIKEIKIIINNYSKKMKKKVLLTVKIPPRLDLCIEKGLDIKYWIKEKLIDFITVSAHWTDDASMPIREFRKELNTKLPIYATIYDGENYPHQSRSHGVYRAIASNYYSEGANGIYLFNYFFKDSILNLYAQTVKKDLVNTDIIPQLLNELGAPESLIKKNKIYTIPENVVEYGYRMNTPLPLFLSPWDETLIHIKISDQIEIYPPLESYLFIRISKNSKVICKVNNRVLNPTDSGLIEIYKRNINLLNSDEVFVFPANSLLTGNNEISIRSIQPSPLYIKRIELLIKFGDVNTHGYF